MIQFKKALNDLWLYKSRSFIVIFAIVLGVAGLGTVITAFAILKSDLNANFLNTNPASATLVTKESLSPKLVQKITQQPSIEVAELRKTVAGRVQVRPNKWIPLLLFVVNDFTQMRVATFKLQSGHLPGLGEMLIERDSDRFLREKQKRHISIRLKGDKRQTLAIVGKVHDPGQAPARMEHLVYGYISTATYAQLTNTKQPRLNVLQIRVAQNTDNKTHIRQVAAELNNFLAQNGKTMIQTYIPEPNEHPHQWQVNALLLLIGGIGLLAFVLSSVLVANIVSFLVGQQIRQIGVMKAIGASKYQVMRLYYLVVFILAVIALVFAIPLSTAAGKSFSQFTATQLNFNIFTQTTPYWVYLVLIGIGLLFPLLVATIPIIKGTRLSVRQAIHHYGLNNQAMKTPLFVDQWLRLSSITRLALRNTFRQKWRPILTIATLALGFALYMVSLNVRQSLHYLIDSSAASKNYDLTYRLGEWHNRDTLTQPLQNVEHIKKITYWKTTRAKIQLDDQTMSNSIRLMVPKAKDSTLQLQIVEGNWLNNQTSNQLVINGRLQLLFPHLRVGRKVKLMLNGQVTDFVITGLVKEFNSETMYISEATYSQLFGKQSLVNQAFIAVKNPPKENSGGFWKWIQHLHSNAPGTHHQASDLSKLSQQIEQRWQAAGIEVVRASVKKAELGMVKAHLNILTFMVLAGAILALAVGGLSLVLTINLNIVERTREMGVMRAIGASVKHLFKMLWVENLLLGSISIVIGALLSFPLGVVITSFLGNLMFETPLDYKISFSGSFSSIIIMLVFVRLALALPRRSLRKTSLRKALVWE
ncbi:hypothetical protein BKI52_44115 [marine bacterium AO1-C]|nr:hypothetical protein BKI52_44115 [marine bacterium AO1-C]